MTPEEKVWNEAVRESLRNRARDLAKHGGARSLLAAALIYPNPFPFDTNTYETPVPAEARAWFDMARHLGAADPLVAWIDVTDCRFLSIACNRDAATHHLVALEPDNAIAHALAASIALEHRDTVTGQDGSQGPRAPRVTTCIGVKRLLCCIRHCIAGLHRPYPRWCDGNMQHQANRTRIGARTTKEMCVPLPFSPVCTLSRFSRSSAGSITNRHSIRCAAVIAPLLPGARRQTTTHCSANRWRFPISFDWIKPKARQVGVNSSGNCAGLKIKICN